MVQKITDIMKKRKEDDHYRNYVEKMIQDNPQDSFLRYAKAFFRMGDNNLLSSKNILLFPVKIIKGRKSFGRLQCLITPLLSRDDVSFANASLGKRWVDRKFLILSHDPEFELYQKHLGEDEE